MIAREKPNLLLVQSIKSRLQLGRRMKVPLDSPQMRQLSSLAEGLRGGRLVLPFLSIPRPSQSARQWWIEEGYKPPDPVSDRTTPLHHHLAKAGDSAALARRSESVWRVRQEAEYATAAGWYLVFDTLTWQDPPPDNKLALQVEWSRYLRKVRDMVGATIYGSVRNARRRATTDYCRYQCVVEHGSKTGRLHLHVIWFLRDVPEDWKAEPQLWPLRTLAPGDPRHEASLGARLLYAHCRPYRTGRSLGEARLALACRA